MNHHFIPIPAHQAHHPSPSPLNSSLALKRIVQILCRIYHFASQLSAHRWSCTQPWTLPWLRPVPAYLLDNSCLQHGSQCSPGGSPPLAWNHLQPSQDNLPAQSVNHVYKLITSTVSAAKAKLFLTCQGNQNSAAKQLHPRPCLIYSQVCNTVCLKGPDSMQVHMCFLQELKMELSLSICAAEMCLQRSKLLKEKYSKNVSQPVHMPAV